MKSSRKCKVTAAFLAAAALGGVAYAAPILNMNDLVGPSTTTESTTQASTSVAVPIAKPLATQSPLPTTPSVPKVTPLIPRVRPIPVPDTAKALSAQHMAVSQPQYVVNKETKTVMEPTLAMHSLINVQRKTEPVVVEKQVDGKQQIQTTQVQRTPVVVQEQSTTPLVVANTTTTKSVVAKRNLTIRDIQRAERERLAQLAAEEAAQKESEAVVDQVDHRIVAEKQAEAQRQAAILAEQQRQMAIQAEQARIAEAQRQAAEQERIAAEQAEAQRQAAIKAEQERQAAIRAEQERIAAEQAEAQRQAAIKAEQERQAAIRAEQERIAAEQAEAQRQAAIKAEQERQAAIRAEQERIAAEQAETQRQAAIKAEQERQAAIRAEQERIAAEQAEAQRQAAMKAEQERQAAIRAEQERIAAEQAEAQRQAAIKAEQERQAAIRAEQERIAAEQAEADAERARLEAEEAAAKAKEAEAKAKAEAEAAAQAQAEAETKAKVEAEAAAQAQAEAEAKAKAEAEAAARAKAEAEAKAKAEAEAAAQAQAEAEAKAKAEAEAAAQAQAEAEAKAKAEAEAAAQAQAEAEAKAKAKAEAEAAAKAKEAAEAKAKAEDEAKQAQEPKLPQSYVDARNQASTKGSSAMDEKNILSQPMEPPLQADTSAKISLAFDVKNYESRSSTIDNKEIKYRAFEYIPYVANPIDIDQQYMNIYVPEEYFNNGTVNGYNTQTAPIFMPNAVGGYMPSQAMAPKVENGKPNSVLYALSRGYVVASPATRGRTNKASDGNFIGKAPAVIVDLQAATAYLHANNAAIPGNANRIITNGTSAGGAVSLLQGATGNSSDFQPYLQALGAATAPTNVYAVSAYAPITNLDAADMAYEWSYSGITSFNKVSMGQGELPQANVGGTSAPPKRTIQRVNLNADDLAYSNLLKERFPDYVNNLQLHDSMGRILKLDKNGNGTFKSYVKTFIIDAANKAQAQGTDLSRHTYLVRDNKTGAIKDINWDVYNQFVSRSKAPGAFDARANDSGENSLFGTSTTDNNHFTITAALHDTTSNQDVYVENAKVVTMMNPMNYLGSPAATNAQFYRIRYGTADSNTSIAIPLIVGTRAQNLGYKVDMSTPFNVDHSGDYDLEDLFNWMDTIVKYGR